MIPFPLQLDKIKAVVFDLDNTLVSSDMNFGELRQQLGCPQSEIYWILSTHLSILTIESTLIT